MIEVAAERGYLDTTIEMVLERAGLGRAEFDRHFRGKYDCFLTAWQEMNEECMEEMLHAFNSEEDWPDRLRAVAEGAVRSLRSDPSRACFAVEVLAAGDAARARRDMTMRVIASLIDAGRQEMEDPDSIPHTTAEALAGAAYGQIYGKVVQGDYDDLPGLVPQLMATAVMPYLGVEAAMEELRREPGATARYRRDMAPEEEPKTEEELPPELARLPPGRHGLPREFIAHNQRERLIAGLAEAVAEHGYGGTTIAHITRQAAVSRRTFYEHFSSKDECFVAAYETVMEKLREQVEDAFEGVDDWPQAVRAGISAMLDFLAAEPNLARLAMVEAQVAGPAVVERYDAAIQSLTPFFRASPEVIAKGNGSATADSPTTAEAIVGGMVSLISRRILAGETEQLAELLPDLVEFALTPYVGPSEAARVARV